MEHHLTDASPYQIAHPYHYCCAQRFRGPEDGFANMLDQAYFLAGSFSGSTYTVLVGP
jgi:hypothetical protein